MTSAPTADCLQSRAERLGQRGFTMIELLIVMAISITGLAGLMSVYMAMAGANADMGESAEAIDVCEKMMEGIRSMSITDIEAVPEYGPITAAGWGPVASHEGDQVGRNGVVFAVDVSAIETPASPGLVRIRVDVRWSDDGKAPDLADPAMVHAVSLEMLRTRVELL